MDTAVDPGRFRLDRNSSEFRDKERGHTRAIRPRPQPHKLQHHTQEYNYPAVLSPTQTHTEITLKHFQMSAPLFAL